jgi:hypothetical protein
MSVGEGVERFVSKMDQPLLKTVWKFFQKLKIEIPLSSNGPTSGHFPKIIQIKISKRYQHFHVHCTTIHNSQKTI